MGIIILPQQSDYYLLRPAVCSFVPANGNAIFSVNDIASTENHYRITVSIWVTVYCPCQRWLTFIIFSLNRLRSVVVVRCLAIIPNRHACFISFVNVVVVPVGHVGCCIPTAKRSSDSAGDLSVVIFDINTNADRPVVLRVTPLLPNNKVAFNPTVLLLQLLDDSVALLQAIGIYPACWFVADIPIDVGVSCRKPYRILADPAPCCRVIPSVEVILQASRRRPTTYQYTQKCTPERCCSPDHRL